LKFEDLRIRKANPEDLPFFRRYPDFVRTNCFVVDLEDQSDDTLKTDKSDRVAAFKTKFAHHSGEEANMDGVEMVGDPLEVSMLSPSRMEADMLNGVVHHGFHCGIEDESSSFDLNPLAVSDARYFFHSLELSDTVKNQLYSAMEFTEKAPKSYTLIFFANANDPQEHTIGFVIRYVDSIKFAGTMHHYGYFTQGIRELVNFKLLAQSYGSKIDSIKCQSCYNALSNSQIVNSIQKWPKFTLPEVTLVYDDEIDMGEENDASSEFIPGMFSIRTNWTEHVKSKQDALDQSEDSQFPVRYFEKPGGLFDTEVIVKPGWMDTRVKGFERSVHLRFLIHLCECLKNEKITWPSKREQPALMESFKNYVANLSVVENTKDSYDFIEGLWDYLCCCRSLASVRAIFKQTYEYYTTGVLNSKFVHHDNTSQTALILKTTDIASAFIPRLDELACVQAIIEVGTDRIRRDLMNELANKKRFPPSTFSESLKLEPRSAVETRVNTVLTMHLVLQSVNLISEHVTIQLAEMQKIFNSLLYQYSKFKEDPMVSKTVLNEEFSFKTKVCNVESFVLETSRLREWSTTYEFLDPSAVRTSYTVHLTRFQEFKKIAHADFSKRFIASELQDPEIDQLYWDNFDCCTFSYGQKSVLPQIGSSMI